MKTKGISLSRSEKEVSGSELYYNYYKLITNQYGTMRLSCVMELYVEKWKIKYLLKNHAHQNAKIRKEK